MRFVINPYCLYISEFVEPFETEFTALATVLDAAGGQAEVGEHDLVDEGHATLQLECQFLCLVGVMADDHTT